MKPLSGVAMCNKAEFQLSGDFALCDNNLESHESLFFRPIMLVEGESLISTPLYVRNSKE